MAAELPFFDTKPHSLPLKQPKHGCQHAPPTCPAASLPSPALMPAEDQVSAAVLPSRCSELLCALHGCSLLTLAPPRLFREGSSCFTLGSSALRTECKCNRDFLLRVFFFFFFKRLSYFPFIQLSLHDQLPNTAAAFLPSSRPSAAARRHPR